MNRFLDRLGNPRRRLALTVALAMAVVLTGLGAYLRRQRGETLPSQYGRRVGGQASRSVNGTFVFGEMFRQRGWRVASHDRFSPALDRYDTLVWVPDDFGPPAASAQTFLEDWLASQPGRTVLYVGRDYDGAWRYWTRVAAGAPPAVAEEVRRRRAAALAEWEAQRSKMPANGNARWFRIQRDAPPHEVRSLTGPWATGIDPRAAELYLASQLAAPVEEDAAGKPPSPTASWEVLLAEGDQPLVVKVTHPTWAGSTLLVVANGSLVLNLPLAFAENRKLAGRLIEACGPPGRVAFVESGPGGPAIASGMPPPPAGWTWLLVWPLNLILLQLVALGLVAVLAQAPQFGRPRELPAPPLADFGRHVAAMGVLLARSRDRQYAAQRLAQYRQMAERYEPKRVNALPLGPR